MSETREPYTLLKPDSNHVTLEAQPPSDAEQIDWAHLERILVPVINYVRKAQGKRAVILPKG